jgi:two-component system nitrate/nitrite response regulator NarL
MTHPILVADGDQDCRAQIRRLLARLGYETTTAETGRQALEAAHRERPALVLLEVNLAEVSGYEVCRELRETFGDELVIIFLSGDRTEPHDRVAGLLLGADDYIVKPFDEGELLARIRSSLRRSVSVDADEDTESAWTSLTTREREVLKLLAVGFSQQDIAGKLVISPKTVGTHIQRVLAKLGVHSRAQAVALEHTHGLTDVEGHAFLVGAEP